MLDYSRISRHLMVTAGDDGSVHLWDTTGRGPKVHFYLDPSTYAVGFLSLFVTLLNLFTGQHTIFLSSLSLY